MKSDVMKSEQYSERRMTLEGFPIRITSYCLDGVYHTAIDNVDPGARVARAEAATCEEAERAALEDAARRLARTRRQPV